MTMILVRQIKKLLGSTPERVMANTRRIEKRMAPVRELTTEEKLKAGWDMLPENDLAL